MARMTTRPRLHFRNVHHVTFCIKHAPGHHIWYASCSALRDSTGESTMPSRRQRAGFSLIELMIVIAIIAILAAIAIPAYQNYVIRAQVTEGLSLASGAKAAVWDYVSNTGEYPSNNDVAGLADAGAIAGNYVSSVNVSGGKVTVSFDQPATNTAIRNQTLTLSPYTHGGSIEWTCASAMPGRYLPSACRS